MNSLFPDNTDSSWQTRLPQSMEAIAFRRQDYPAEYRQLKNDVALNLDADAIRHGVYLGTYFPRTFIESYNLHRTLLTLKPINRAWAARQQVNVFDFGCGTGGNLAGLLYAMRDIGLHVPVRAWCVDGNGDALSIQARITALVSEETKIPVDIRQTLRTMPSDATALAKQLRRVAQNAAQEFDLVMAWKSLSELYITQSAAQGHSCPGQYGAFIRGIAPRLAETGVISILDLTFPSWGRWLPQLLNTEIKEVMTEHWDLNFLMPFGCALQGQRCTRTDCYTKFTHRVSHALHPGDTAKFTFFALARPQLHQAVCPDLAPELPCPRRVRQLPLYLQKLLAEEKKPAPTA